MATITLWQKLTHISNKDAEGVLAMSRSPLGSRGSHSPYGLLVKAGIMCVLQPAIRNVCCLSVPISGGISPFSG
jgi:hypothetical protein